MTEDNSLLEDPEFQELLSQRSRWRWGLSGSLIGSYLAYALGGVYFAELYARPFGESSIPRGVVFGLLIIIVSIALSLVYILAVNRLKVFTPGTKKTES